MELSGTTITFEIGPVWTVVRFCPPAVHGLIARLLTARHPAARFIGAGIWNGEVCLLRRGAFGSAFPSGCVPRIVAALRASGVTVARTTAPSAPPFPSPLDAATPLAPALRGYVPRPHQLDAVERGLRAVRAAIQVGTSGGKTLIGAELIRRINRPTLWLTHRRQLLEQVARDLHAMLGVEPAIWAGERRDPPGPVTLATMQTAQQIGQRGADWGRFQMLIIDECQIASSTAWYDISFWLTSAWIRFGLSGTVKTGDPLRDLKLEAITGPLLDVIGTPELIRQEIIAKPVFVFVRVPADTYPRPETVCDIAAPGWRADRRRLRTRGAALFATTYRLGVIENASRNQLLCTLAHRHAAMGDKVLLLVSKVEHGDRLRDVLCHVQQGAHLHTYPVFWLHGAHPVREREQALAAFRAAPGGAILVASPIFDVGMNVPEIDVGILGGGGSSLPLHEQRIGRMLRRRPDKPEVLIYDIADGCAPLPVTQPLHKRDYLAHHTRQRLTLCRARGFTVRIVEAAEVLASLAGPDAA